MTNCSICNKKLNGEYCNSCGQQFTGKKLDLKSFFGDLSSNVFDIDKSLIINLYQIIRFPKKVIENFWNGYRNYYYNPGKFLFYFITIAGLSSILLKNSLFGLNLLSEGLMSTQFIFILLYYPFHIASSYLAYWRNHKTIVEHATASIYLISALGIILLVIQNIFTVFEWSKENDPIWILILTILAVLWKSLLFSTKRNFFYILLNAFIEFIFFLLIIAISLVATYYSGTLEIN